MFLVCRSSDSALLLEMQNCMSSIFYKGASKVVLVGIYGILASGSLLFDSEIRENERIHFWFTVITIVINVVFLCEVMIKCAAYSCQDSVIEFNNNFNPPSPLNGVQFTVRKCGSFLKNYIYIYLHS